MKILLPFALLVAFVAAAPIDNYVGATPTAPLPSRILASMVKIATVDPSGEHGFCSGFVLDISGKVVTATHCVQDTMWVDGMPSKVIKKDNWVAIVEGPPVTKPPLPLAKDEPKVLDRVFSVGNAYDWGWVVLERTVAGWFDSSNLIFQKLLPGLPHQDHKDLIVNAPLAPGQSGGPIVNVYGEVVAINQISTGAIGVGCSVEDLKNLLKKKD